MMRLLILRHATAASQGTAPGDRERPLSAQGRDECHRLGTWLQRQRVEPDIVLCSPSQRTRETWDLASVAGSTADVRFLDALYLGSAEDYLGAVDEVGGSMTVLVGHNPTCAALAAEFLQAAGESFAGHFPPASLCVAERSAEGWRAVDLVLGTELPKAE